MKRVPCFAFVLSFTTALIASTCKAQVKETPAAGCYIRDGQAVLLIKDIWSQRYSLPGGGGQVGESFEDTAQRETLEETGLHVNPRKVLVVAANGFRIYDCAPQSESLQVLSDRSHVLPPRQVFNEVSEVVFKIPSDIPLSQWRFQSQRSLVVGLTTAGNANTNSSYSMVLNPIYEVAPPWLKGQLNFIEILQGGRHPFWRGFFNFVSFLGSASFLILLVICLCFIFGFRYSLEIAFLYSASSLIHGVLKGFFQTLRPFHYVPALQLSGAEGFGFPSGHTQGATLVWGWLALHSVLKKRWPFAVICILLCGLSRIYLGVHFPHDVLGGWLFGALVLSVYELALRLLRTTILPLKSWAVVLALLSITALVVRPHPDSVGVVSLLLGILVGLLAFFRDQASQYMPAPQLQVIYRVMVAIGGLILIEILSHFTFPAEADFMFSLRFMILKYFVLGFWLVASGLFKLNRLEPAS